MKLQKTFSLLLFFLFLTLNACAKTNSKAEQTETKSAITLSAEEEKLNKVFLNLSQRCRNSILNGDPKEFLADLKKVFHRKI